MRWYSSVWPVANFKAELAPQCWIYRECDKPPVGWYTSSSLAWALWASPFLCLSWSSLPSSKFWIFKILTANKAGSGLVLWFSSVLSRWGWLRLLTVWHTCSLFCQRIDESLQSSAGQIHSFIAHLHEITCISSLLPPFRNWCRRCGTIYRMHCLTNEAHFRGCGKLDRSGMSHSYGALDRRGGEVDRQNGAGSALQDEAVAAGVTWSVTWCLTWAKNCHNQLHCEGCQWDARGLSSFRE